MEVVYVVEAGIDYSGSSPVRAFANKDAAKRFAKLCKDYEATRPSSPRGFDQGGFDEWRAKSAAWTAAHPGGERGEGCDSFDVVEVPFVSKESP